MRPAAPASLALAVVASKALASLLVVATGFHALSDDDFARVVIAQGFAAAPTLDPSGTSWLPLPFWVVGAAHAVVGPAPAVSRWATVALGLGGAWLLFRAALAAGVSARGAAVGAAAAGVFPYAAVLGVAAVPEGWTAALIAAGALTVGAAAGPTAAGGARPASAAATPPPAASGALRVAGGAALGAATLARYEAWPVAAGFAALCLLDAARARARRGPLVIAAALAVIGMAAWMLHGAVHHGSATFFVERVAAYRRAVGAAGADTLSRLVGYPGAVLRCEPELVALFAPGVALGARTAAFRARWRRPALLGGLLLVFLVAGDLRDGAPTHHGERAVLTLWIGLCLAGADGWALALPGATPARRRAWLGATLAAALVALGVVRPWYSRRDAFADRRAEVAAGAALGARLEPGARALAWTQDYGFYAVMAGAARPGQVRPLHDRDPRRPRPEPAGPAELAARLAEEGATWVVLPEDRAAWLAGVAEVAAAPPGFRVARAAAPSAAR